MGLTGFNLARRNEEAASAASLSCPAPASPSAQPTAEPKPKRRRAPKAAATPDLLSTASDPERTS